MILYKFVSYFSKPYCIFYAFLNFIQFSGNVKEIENSKTGAHNAGPALAHGPGTVGSARRQGLAREHHGVSGVTPSKMVRRGSHRRGWSMTRGGGVEATVQWRFTAVGEFRCSMTRATGSCSTRGPRGMRGGQRGGWWWPEVGAHRRGQSEATLAVLRQLTVDRRARGEGGARALLEKEKGRGRKRRWCGALLKWRGRGGAAWDSSGRRGQTTFKSI
jgi:hypothetical protein